MKDNGCGEYKHKYELLTQPPRTLRCSVCKSWLEYEEPKQTEECICKNIFDEAVVCNYHMGQELTTKPSLPKESPKVPEKWDFVGKPDDLAEYAADRVNKIIDYLKEKEKDLENET